MKIFIIGPSKLQNALIRDLLTSSLGKTCLCCECQDVSFFDDTGGRENYVVLRDCLNADSSNLWEEIRVHDYNRFQCLLALFNVHPEWAICEEAIRRGIKGIFFEHDPPKILAKGVQAIMNKELWFPRDKLARCLEDTKYWIRDPQERQCSLTPREKEILLLIVSGGTTVKIAEELSISPNTVKTHVQNIFNKIDVSNRLEAALWAVKNI